MGYHLRVKRSLELLIEGFASQMALSETTWKMKNASLFWSIFFGPFIPFSDANFGSFHDWFTFWRL